MRCQIDKSVFLICRCFFLFAVRFFFWLCCEHLQRVRCQIDESVFLICRCFFLFAARFFFGCVVSICSVCVCRCFFDLQRVELSRPPYLSLVECTRCVGAFAAVSLLDVLLCFVNEDGF